MAPPLKRFDGTRVRRIDFLGTVHMDPDRKDGVLAVEDKATGYLRIDVARLTRVGVFTYGDGQGDTWGELRTEDQVADPASLRSFELKPLTDDHPSEFVTSTNIKDLQKGTIGSDVTFRHPFVEASIIVTDAVVIQKIKDGKVELSCGYTAQVIADSGTTDSGVSFAARQTNIRGNHVALVDRGRAGSECRIPLGRGDAFHLITQGHDMKTRKITIDGVEHEVLIAVADAYEAAQKQLQDQFPPKDKDKDEDESEDAAGRQRPAPAITPEPAVQPTGDAATLGAMQARIDLLETRAKDVGARTDARVDLVSRARGVMGLDYAVAGKSDALIMAEVIVQAQPSMKARVDAHKDNAGYLSCAFDGALEFARQSVRDVADANGALFAVVNDGLEGDPNPEIKDVLDAYDGFLDRHDGRGKQPAEADKKAS